MLYEEWKSRYKNLKNFNTVLQRCPRFWPLAPPRGMNPGVYSLGISEDPPRYLSSKFDASVRSDCWDISIWKTLTQCDGNGNANANVDDRGDYNSSPCTSYRRAKNKTQNHWSMKYRSQWPRYSKWSFIGSHGTNIPGVTFIQQIGIQDIRQNHWTMKYRSHQQRYILTSIIGSQGTNIPGVTFIKQIIFKI